MKTAGASVSIDGLQCGTAMPPCRLLGRMTPNGYQPENYAWLPILTYPDERLGWRRRAGRDPMTLPRDMLCASGHPPHRTGALVSALSNPRGVAGHDGDGDPVERLREVRGYGDIRAYCDECAESAYLRRKCAIINCPFWAYRMGRNPHNPRRGIQPIFAPVRAENRQGIDGRTTLVTPKPPRPLRLPDVRPGGTPNMQTRREPAAMGDLA